MTETQQANAMMNQPDLFPHLPGADLKIDPEEVRTELCELLRIARAAHDCAPWDRRTHEYHAVVFPQMARWLPGDEAEQLCLEFEAELVRLEALLAA